MTTTPIKVSLDGTCETLPFYTWNLVYSAGVESVLGLPPDCLPDLFSERQAYDDGSTVREAIEDCVTAQMDDLGFDDNFM